MYILENDDYIKLTSITTHALAQLVEHGTPDLGDVSSSPTLGVEIT